ncbi:MAG: hypothetical protein BWX47_01766 [candidate division Hyd24-12 bacterium ADurb.Bin004]|nr:MAG: hypothetical protein BWX47_01766 [candidate division Hyd24-12 bacterium ADurb.Bin004]
MSEGSAAPTLSRSSMIRGMNEDGDSQSGSPSGQVTSATRLSPPWGTIDSLKFLGTDSLLKAMSGSPK